MPAGRYMEENDSVAMLAAKRSAGVTPEVNLSEHVTHDPSTNAECAQSQIGDLTGTTSVSIGNGLSEELQPKGQ